MLRRALGTEPADVARAARVEFCAEASLFGGNLARLDEAGELSKVEVARRRPYPPASRTLGAERAWAAVAID